MKQPRKILLVDDEEDFLETTSRRLGLRSFEVRTATCCADALPEVTAGWPDVVVLDVMLPGTDGFACLQHFKKVAPNLPVIMLTGHASMQSSVKGLQYGASDYCLKPIELSELVEKIIIAYKDAGI
jgi:two-component system, OmpR family, response regulator